MTRITIPDPVRRPSTRARAPKTVPCCWARALLASPPEDGPIEPLACAATRCTGSTCRHTPPPTHETGLGAAIVVARESPCPANADRLTRMILDRLAAEGLPPSPAGDDPGPVRRDTRTEPRA